MDPEDPLDSQTSHDQNANSSSFNGESSSSSNNLLQNASKMFKSISPVGHHNTWDDFGGYMTEKNSKLLEQDRELAQREGKSTLFQGIRVHINGLTNPPQAELKRMLVTNGGIYLVYWKKTDLDYLIADNLTDRKAEIWSDIKVVRPAWLVDSIKHGKVLPWQNYKLVQETNSSQLSLKPLVKPLTSIPMDALKKSPVKELHPELQSEWAKQNSSMAPDFLERFYGNSRLHLISTSKTQLQEFVRERMLDPDLVQARESRRKTGECLLMHVDLDCFFASVALRHRPDLAESPVAICHANANQSGPSHAELASCNYPARKYGIRNGMWLNEAKRLCPDLILLPYNFEEYIQVSREFYTILTYYADEIQAVSIDEAYLDISSHLSSKTPLELAHQIRKDIFDQTQCTASIGMGENMLLARIATRKAKPNGAFLLSKQEAPEIMKDISVDELPGIGYQNSKKMLAKTIKELLLIPKHQLQALFGEKLGETFYNYARGIDNRTLTLEQERKSISASANWGVRFSINQEAESFIQKLGAELAKRMTEAKVLGSKLTFQVQKRREANAPVKPLGMGWCDTFTKTINLATSTRDEKVIARECWAQYQQMSVDAQDVRGMTMQMTKLIDEKQNRNNLQQMELDFSKSPTKSKNARVDLTELEEVIKDLPEKEKLAIRCEHGLLPRAPTLTQMIRQPVKEKRKLTQVSPSKAQDWIDFGASQVDLDVFEQLPRDLQESLSKQLGLKKNVAKRVKVEQTILEEAVESVEEISLVNGLQGLAAQYSDRLPDSKQVEELIRHLSDLVKARQLDHVMSMLRWIQRKGWPQSSIIIQTIQDKVYAIYASRLLL